jgi:hypothetical protein
VPKILSPDEVARLIDAASNLQARAILMLLYSTGVRRSELVRLRVEDIDNERMIVHIRQGKGGKAGRPSVGRLGGCTISPAQPSIGLEPCRNHPQRPFPPPRSIDPMLMPMEAK